LSPRSGAEFGSGARTELLNPNPQAKSVSTYYLKQYRCSFPDPRAGKLVVQQAIEVATDDAAVTAAQPLVRELGSEAFVRLEDQAGRMVAFWRV
jgi:hypothetical protein